MRARHLPLVLLGAAVLAACGVVPARREHTLASAPARAGVAAHVAARPTGPAPLPPAPVAPPPPAVPAAYRSACAATGGRIAATTGADWAPGTCVVSYPREGTFPVTIDPSGAFDSVWAQRNQTDCGLLAYDAQLDAAAHHPWRLPPLYYPQTGVCFSGQPA